MNFNPGDIVVAKIPEGGKSGWAGKFYPHESGYDARRLSDGELFTIISDNTVFDVDTVNNLDSMKVYAQVLDEDLQIGDVHISSLSSIHDI